MGFNVVIILFSLSHCFISSKAAYGSDSLAVNHTLSLNNTLVSSRGIFELGFFTPGSSLKEYVGVWYYKEKKTIIWVANRQHPVIKTPGKLILHQTGVLEISDRENATVWSSNSVGSVLNPVAQLLDTGNFVVGDKIRIALDQFIWQGFDYPCDTRVTKMKIGYDKRRKRNVYESSWKSLDDPAEGEYVFKLDITGIPQYFLTKGLIETFRTGPWNGETFSGIPHLNPDSFYRMAYIDDDDWIYFLLEPISSSVLSRTVLGVNGTWLRFIATNQDTLNWKMTLAFVTDNCDTYNWCGPYATCDIHKTPICECLAGYVPKSPSHWHISNWTEGCVRSATLNYSTEDKFYKLSNIKVPDTRNAYGNLSWSLEECRIACLENYSCTAYGKMYVSYEGRGCLLWFGKLKDIRVYAGSGQNIFVRGDYSGKAGQDVKVIIISSMVAAVVLAFVVIFIICCRGKKPQNHQQRGTKEETSQRGNLTETNSSDLDLPLFDIETILRATNNFSVENKLGEGGFGPVYKGILQDGQEIAVKKLSHDSKQGTMEFKNEVMCIAKLQHRNLVKLLGCCIQEEFMLIYEFMPNKSLDLLIFDGKESALLDWPKRLNIINGIARGMLYLHQDSRLRIIHRDLKASNVLLDSDLNPKISDFGMARICGGAETAANTTRVVGTYGYMAPEYAIDGLFSIKSDVYSFGVLVLEIISGRGNRGFHHSEHRLNLLGHIWNLFNEERSMEAVDTTLKTSCNNQHEVTRVIHIGLLCVQENPKDRPTMATAVLMLSSDTKLLPPKAPGFFTARKIVETESSSSDLHSCSANGMSFTLMNPR